MFTRRSNNNWMLMSSAVVGGFLLGLTYKKYGKDIRHQIQKITKKDFDYDDYMTSHEPDA
jgi:hypothetical protein